MDETFHFRPPAMKANNGNGPTQNHPTANQPTRRVQQGQIQPRRRRLPIVESPTRRLSNFVAPVDPNEERAFIPTRIFLDRIFNTLSPVHAPPPTDQPFSSPQPGPPHSSSKRRSSLATPSRTPVSSPLGTGSGLATPEMVYDDIFLSHVSPRASTSTSTSASACPPSPPSSQMSTGRRPDPPNQPRYMEQTAASRLKAAACNNSRTQRSDDRKGWK